MLHYLGDRLVLELLANVDLDRLHLRIPIISDIHH